MLRTRGEAVELINNLLAQLEKLYHSYNNLNDLVNQGNKIESLKQINEFYSFLKYYLEELLNANNDFDPNLLKNDKEVLRILANAKNHYSNTDFSHMDNLVQMWGTRFDLNMILKMTGSTISHSSDEINKLVSGKIKKIKESLSELEKLRLYYSQLNLSNFNEKNEEINQILETLNYYLNDLESYLFEIQNNQFIHPLYAKLDEQLKVADEYISNLNKIIINTISNKLNTITAECLLTNKAKKYYISKNDNVHLVKDTKGLGLANKDIKLEPKSPISIIFFMKERIDSFKEKLMNENYLTSDKIANITDYPTESLIQYIHEIERKVNMDNQFIDLDNKEQVEFDTAQSNKLNKSLKKSLTTLIKNSIENKIKSKKNKIEKRTSTLSTKSQISPLSGNKSDKFVKYANKLGKHGNDIGYTANIASRTISEANNRTSISYDYNRGKGHKEKTINITQDVIVNNNEIKSQLTSDINKLNKLNSNQAKFAAVQWVEDALEKTPKGNKATITLEKYGSLNKDFVKTVVFYCQENGHKINLIPDNIQLTQLTEKEKKELRQFFENRKLLTISKPAPSNAPVIKIQHEKK